jgi:hypothetical protein
MAADQFTRINQRNDCTVAVDVTGAEAANQIRAGEQQIFDMLGDIIGHDQRKQDISH